MGMFDFITSMWNRLLLLRAGFCCPGGFQLGRTGQSCAETLRLPLMAALCGTCVALGLTQMNLLKTTLEQSERHGV